MAGKSTTWVGGTVVVALLILVATWFVGISPTLAATSTAHDAADASDTRNVQLRADLDRLEQQFAQLDASKAELAAIGRQIPPQAQLAEYIRTVQATAEATGVAFIGYVAGEPELVIPVEVEAPAPAVAEEPEASEGAEGAEDGAEPAATETVPAGFVPVEGFVGMALEVIVLGPAANVSAFVDQLQNGPERLYLVTALDGEGQKEEEGRNGRPATAEGDIELKITGYLYGLAPTTTPAPTEEPTLAPLPSATPPRMSAAN
ncbi:hypothetical protein J1G44_17805 [Cellulomonas sp. zg-ZUI199]|uniref:Pilus assembly protein PilO n=1 Tax=Cellulomonas wangleii TaxID=2816956 RepID=A0ABX8D958_9CELL|nr:hypothetical protein [Cellulomonas wangleii]MBO0926333.1 hypothetical protein [Cellulomonas wangleii]QVI63982.1 hypothetical protein KG103_09310 [Cellulomonas wangleii]